MKLRIVSGTLKGRAIVGPDKDLSFRPTLERVRQSIADMITPRCASGGTAADLCAGSGAFGFEMLSRGARRVDFVESDRRRGDLIAAHAEKFGVAPQCRIVVSDVARFIAKCTDRYDIIFFDPPYDDAAMKPLLPAIRALLTPNGVLIHQRRKLPMKRGAISDNTAGTPGTIKTFGDTIVELYDAPHG